MASELKVDKFTGVTTAGSIDVTGEGNSTTTNLQQGLAKAWYIFDGGRTSGNVALEDDFNISSLLDSSGAGNTTLNFANNMNSATTYTVVNSTFITSTQSNISGCVSRTTSAHVIQDSHDNGSQTDMERTYGAVFGDLA
jgi:hypothetical protein